MMLDGENVQTKNPGKTGWMEANMKTTTTILRNSEKVLIA